MGESKDVSEEQVEYEDQPAHIVQRDRGEANIMPDDMDEQIEVTQKQVAAINDLIDNVLEEGVDYGEEQGIDKPFLHKPGAEQLCVTFRLAPRFTIIDKTIDLEHPEFPLIDYDVRCDLYNRETGQWVGSGVGNCNSWEKKYRYRKEWYNGDGEPDGSGWEETRGGNYYKRVPNEDIMTQKNTILKMSKKRAHVDATLNTTGASRLFTQDEGVVSQSQAANSTSTSSGSYEPDPDSYPPSGKHSEDGQEPKKWKNVPEDYLEYLSGQDYGRLSEGAEKELERRDGDNEQSSNDAHGGQSTTNNDTPQDYVKELLENSDDIDTDEIMDCAKTTAEDYGDETEGWREVYKYLKNVIEGDEELSITSEGKLDIIPF